ncbi:hypothetical protein Q6344_06595 [Psychrobacter cibarius]|nr:hypothetical protein Q6344_06595 [Psychrobacter cibarius]
MNHSRRKLIDEAYTANVRCEKMIPIYMCLADTLSEDLTDAIFGCNDVCNLLQLPNDIEGDDCIAEELQRNSKVGYLAQFATPTPHNFSSDGSVCFSDWGWCQTKWFYADDIGNLESPAISWAHTHFEECKARATSYG